MRLLVLGVALLITTTAAAQSRWIVSAGPQWNPLTNQIAGLLRAEYDVLRPDRPLRLRLEAGGLWGPTSISPFPISCSIKLFKGNRNSRT